MPTIDRAQITVQMRVRRSFLGGGGGQGAGLADGFAVVVEGDGLRRRGLVSRGRCRWSWGVSGSRWNIRSIASAGSRGTGRAPTDTRATALSISRRRAWSGRSSGALASSACRTGARAPARSDRAGRLVGDGGQGGLGGVARERRLALDRAVEGDAEGPQVGGGAAGGDGPVLGGQVAGGVGHRPGGGDVGVADEGGHAEVGQADGTVVGQEDAGRAHEPVRRARPRSRRPGPRRRPGPTTATRSGDMGPSAATRSARVGPSTSSVTTRGGSWASRTSTIRTRPGWSRADRVRASATSFSVRAVRAACSRISGKRISLTATSPSSSRSRARHTTPMPPERRGTTSS